MDKSKDLAELMGNEIRDALAEMDRKRKDATYIELARMLAILIDAWLLLRGKPNKHTLLSDKVIKRR